MKEKLPSAGNCLHSEHSDGKRIKNRQAVARLPLECWPATSSGQLLEDAEEKCRAPATFQCTSFQPGDSVRRP